MIVSENEIRELLRPFGLPLYLRRDEPAAGLPGAAPALEHEDQSHLGSTRAGVSPAISARACTCRFVRLEGGLLDIGSGAGFPGLALKITFPKLRVTLLEPVGKKRAFLKEVARACEMDLVRVRSERLGEFVKEQIETGRHRQFEGATSRAVARPSALIPEAAQCLERGGGLYLWLGDRQREDVFQVSEGLVDWKAPIPIPLAEHREIWCGSRGS